MQTKLQSLVEAVLNTGIGYLLSVVIGQFVYPRFGYDVTVADNAAMTAIFVGASLTRAYIFRRVFNWYHGRSK